MVVITAAAGAFLVPEGAPLAAAGTWGLAALGVVLIEAGMERIPGQALTRG